MRRPDPAAVAAFFANERRRFRVASGCDEATAFREAVVEFRKLAAELAANPIRSTPPTKELPC